MSDGGIYLLIIVVVGFLYGMAMSNSAKSSLGVVRRVKNLKPKPNENEYYNIVLVDIDGTIAELAFTDAQIIRASERMSKNAEDTTR